jgi:prevent-host-death family protein
VATIPQKELRNNVAEVLRRAESGEELTITVSGRPVASMGPAKGRRWVPSAQLAELWAALADPSLETDLEKLDTELRDPWAR